MSILELKKLLARIKAGENEAVKYLHAHIQQFVELVRAGDKRAEEVLEFYLADKIDFLIKRNPHVNPADRADLKQDALVAVFANIKNGKFDAGLGDLGGYAYGIAQNRIRDYRKKSREQTMDSFEMHLDPDQNCDDLDYYARKMIKEAIARLPERPQEVLRLYFFEGLKMNEVSNLAFRPRRLII